MSNDSITPPDATILVTGSNGFLGARVVAELLRRGYRNIRCFVRPSSKLARLQEVIAHYGAEKEVELVEGDLFSREDCRKAADGVAVVYHLAAGFDKSVEGVLRNSVDATRNLVQACGESVRLRRFVLVSSFAVYSNATLDRQALLDESCPIEASPENRHDAYSLGKIRQEEIIRRFTGSCQLPWVIVRPGTVIGPGKPELTGRIGLRISRFFFFLGGDNRLPLTFVDNCAEAVVLAGMCPGVEGEAFNVVDDGEVTCREFLTAYRKRVGGLIVISLPYRLVFGICTAAEWLSPLMPGFSKRFNRARCMAEWKGNRFTNHRLRQGLGWQPRVPIVQALDRYFSQFESIAS